MPTILNSVIFYGILDTGYVSPQQWLSKYDALVAGGASIIQIRAKLQTSAERATLLERVLERRNAEQQENQPFLVVNDDIELCLQHPNLGLHIGQDDLPATEARARLGSDRIIGLSTHSPEQVNSAIELPQGILNYFAVGPVFATKTKPDYIPVGLELVRYVAKQNPTLPFFCIGGINRQNIEQVREAGAKRVVTVSDVLCARDTAAAVSETIRKFSDR